MIDEAWAGSSPLTRGKPWSRGSQQGASGLIPAHAGKTLIGKVRPGAAAAHPRSRGENAVPATPGLTLGGSSPLTRGKRVRFRARGQGRGLIPAHAGKTIFQALLTRTTGAHPRSRGENVVVCLPPSAVAGSSPLTRGKHCIGGPASQGPGLIPAHAGKTTPPPEAREPLWAHPRSRGENVTVSEGWERLTGSSPLTRGKHLLTEGAHVVDGLIPAHAGKTIRVGVFVYLPRAHPRSRGENHSACPVPTLTHGSSPLTRGKLSKVHLCRLNPRLIPAHAGKTSIAVTSMPPARAHPRSRGENGDVRRSDFGGRVAHPRSRGENTF